MHTHIVIKVIMKNWQRLRTVARKRNTSRLKYEKRNPPHSLRILINEKNFFLIIRLAIMPNTVIIL